MKTLVLPFDPKIWFDLSQFSHHKVFRPEKPVWDALAYLVEYLSTLTFGVIEGTVEPGAYIACPEKVYIGRGTVVEAGAYIRGPCWIGGNCQIRHGAYLRENVILGEGVIVGHSSEVKHSILLNRAKAPHFAFVGDSIIGSAVNLGAGVKCANLRLDRQEVRVGPRTERVSTGLKKLGAIIGDESSVGCNVVFNPGTLIGKKCRCLPGLVIGGFFEDSTHIEQSS